MKFPSISSITSTALSSLKRFPFAIVLTIFSSIVAIYIVEQKDFDLRNNILTNFIFASFITFPFFISVKLIAESFIKNKLVQHLLSLLPITFLFFYTFWLPETAKLNDYYIIISLILILIFHLSVSFAPFLRKTKYNIFWQFNNYLFQRFLVSGLFSVVLYAGLSIALLSFNALFDFNVDSNLYLELLIIIVGIFSTWFFLSGVPKNIESLEYDIFYPKGLKIFTQFVLLPIVLIYLLILYSYIVKIVAQGEWPIGWVSYLVLGFSTTGIFSLLLIYPLQFKKENIFIYKFSKWFYFAIFPLIILLFMAINVRISDYGITENRYFVLALATWLTFISVYLLITKQRNIKIIPISLSIIAIISIIGPFSAFNISKNSQFNRLKTILTENKIIKDGRVVKADKKIDFETSKDISSIVSYIVNMHGHSVLQPLFTQNLDSMFVDTVRYYDKDMKITELMGVEYISHWNRVDVDTKYYYFNVDYNDNQNPVNISDYDYYFLFDNYFGDTKNEKIVNIQNIKFASENGYNYYILDDNGNKLLEINTLNFWQQKMKKYNSTSTLSKDELSFKAQNDSISVMLLFNSFNLNKTDSNNIVVSNASLDVFVKTE